MWLDLLPCTGLYLEHLMPAAPDAAVHFIELTEQTTQFAQASVYRARPNRTTTTDGLTSRMPAWDVATCIFPPRKTCHRQSGCGCSPRLIACCVRGEP